MVNSLLFNCETFGGNIPKDLEKTYNKLLRCAFNVRMNTPILTLYIESGFLSVKALILARQLKIFTRYKEGLLTPSRRVELLNRLMEEPTAFLQHYIDITSKYNSPKDIYEESNKDLQIKIRVWPKKENTNIKFMLISTQN